MIPKALDEAAQIDGASRLIFTLKLQFHFQSLHLLPVYCLVSYGSLMRPIKP